MFRRIKLSEIGQIVAGGTPKTKTVEYWNGDIPWITPKDLSSHTSMHISKGERNISKNGLDNSSAKLLPKGTVLFTSRAPIGYVAIADNEVTTNQGFKSIIVNDDNDNIFVYYLLKNNISAIENYANGSTFKEISGTVMKNLEFDIPSLKEQKAIVHILSTLDEKIEVNNQVNKTLENMAQAIFKQWFVDFEFPNEDGEPYKSSGGEMVESELGMIPKGWEVKRVNDVTRIVRGASPRPIQHFMVDDGIPWVKISDATTSDSRFLASTKEFIKEEGRSKSREVTIGTLILSNSATPGIPKIMKINACVHDGWLIFDEFKTVNRDYMYYFLKHERDSILQLSNGSVFRNLKTDILKNYKIVVPRLDVMENADKLFRGISELLDNVESQNGQLIKLRDSLLPKLMSGEIRVPLD